MVRVFMNDISSQFAYSIVHLTSMRKETYETLFTVMSCPKALFELSLRAVVACAAWESPLLETRLMAKRRPGNSTGSDEGTVQSVLRKNSWSCRLVCLQGLSVRGALRTLESEIYNLKIKWWKTSLTKWNM